MKNEFTNIIKDEKLLNYFHVGDELVIIKRPNQWSSLFGGNSPFTSDIKFPYVAKIVKIGYSYDNKHTAIFDGVYGWSLTSLIKNDSINFIKTLRKLKLEKLEKYEIDLQEKLS